VPCVQQCLLLFKIYRCVCGIPNIPTLSLRATPHYALRVFINAGELSGPLPASSSITGLVSHSNESGTCSISREDLFELTYSDNRVHAPEATERKKVAIYLAKAYSLKPEQRESGDVCSTKRAHQLTDTPRSMHAEVARRWHRPERLVSGGVLLSPPLISRVPCIRLESFDLELFVLHLHCARLVGAILRCHFSSS
jgi:hypothetical protein